MIKLSLCIPAHNEEKNLHLPLDSAYDLVDEVVIINAASTDKTKEVALKYGDKIKIYDYDNPTSFLINKQRAIEKASGQWILQLDADEALSNQLKEEIKNIINDKDQLTANLVGYYLPRKNYFLGRFLMKGGVYPDYVLRLYRRNCAFFKAEHLHENVQIKGKVGYLKEAILHYADPDFSRYLLRWDRYTSFDAEELIKKGESISFLSYFLFKPLSWFLATYIRHRGFYDGFPGFVFSLFSALRFWVIYIKWWSKKIKYLL
jgi:glycosyltransferase involved in cell wall biosynthesis